MESMTRVKLEEQLRDYIIHTLKCCETVTKFCDGESKWNLQRETELETMRDIKDRADQITLRFDHVQKSENKAKALGKYMWNRLTQFKADSKRQKLEKELGEVLKNTLEGLEKLTIFLNAVEKLAVTSLFVFMGESFMPEGVSSMSVRSVISTARIVSPLLVYFKRDQEAFFLPSLSNVEVMASQLDRYICITQQICEKMKKKSRSVSASTGVHQWNNRKLTLKIEGKSEDSVQQLYSIVRQLNQIRTDDSFRCTFIFGEKAQEFINLFSDCGPKMFQFLSDLEEAAVKLDRMKKGSHISTIAGSSVGVTGGILSIVGLALSPVTAGVSLALTLTGVGLGVTSGVNGIVTSITEMAVNNHHGKNANNTFTSFMEDVQKILDCVEEVASTERPVEGPDGVTTALNVGKVVVEVAAVGKSTAIINGASAVTVLKSEEVIAKAFNAGLQEAAAGRNIPKLASDLPDIGQLAKGTPLALTKTARAGFITLNALFIGLDAFFIVSNSVSLAKGSKNAEAQVIRDRSVLWRSEVEAWEKIYDHLFKGISGFQKNLEILEKPFNI